MSEGVAVWTDGGCVGNPGPGGWAFVAVLADRTVERTGFEKQTTNNRMELVAVREALKECAAGAPGAPITLSTDSQYVQKGITEWIHSWARNGWKTSAKKPVKNLDLWQELWDLSRSSSVTWKWVLGHAGNELNERCDSLVQEAIAKGLKQGE